MTREEAEEKICAMESVLDELEVFIESPLGDKPAMIGMVTQDATASDLRAIADILDQVGKEDGKAGEG